MFLTIFLISAFDFWNLRQTKNNFEHEKEQLALLESDKRKEEFIKENLEELKDRNQLLSNLSKDLFPWRSLLIHFGTLKVDGVWLREIRALENNKIELKGEALNYELVSSYITSLENDRDIFKTNPPQIIQDDKDGKLIKFVVILEFSL